MNIETCLGFKAMLFGSIVIYLAMAWSAQAGVCL